MLGRLPTLLSLGLTLGLALLASPLSAQGRGPVDRGGGAYPEREAGQGEHATGRADKDAGPPFCRNGEGHPVFGMQWCEEKGFGRGWPAGVLHEDGRYARRIEDYPAGDSYERAHDDFHRYLDRQYRELAAQRPLDLQYQIRLRVDKAAEHDRWHEQSGTRH